jgi:DNA polymerase-1
LIRNKFIAREGYDFIGADYGQEEYRLIGLFDSKIADFYKSGNNDVHLLTGALLAGKPIDQITSDERKSGKTMNFAVGFGTTAWGLHKNFNMEIEKAKKYLDDFYNKIYTELRDSKKTVGKLAWERGYSRTFLGRKRFFERPSLFSDGKEFEKFYARTEREAFNHIPQGSSADILKLSLCDCFYNNPYGSNWQMLLQVYDEIDSEADKGISEKVEQFIKETMIENLQKYLKDIPAVVDSYRAPFWRKD